MKITVWLIFNFGRTVVRSFFYCGLFNTLIFLLLSVGFSGDKEGHTSQHPNVLVGLRRPHIRRESFLAFCTKFESHTLKRRPSDRVHAKCVLLNGAFMSKNVATFVPKVALIWLKSAFLLQLFRTKMYFLALNCYHWDKRDNSVMWPGCSPNIKG